jgi:hypothetical protein
MPEFNTGLPIKKFSNSHMLMRLLLMNATREESKFSSDGRCSQSKKTNSAKKLLNSEMLIQEKLSKKISSKPALILQASPIKSFLIQASLTQRESLM